MKKRKFFAACQIDKLNVSPVVDPGVSMTEPDQSLSIQQILKRVSEGKTTGLLDQSTLEYDDPNDNDFEDPTLQPGFDKLDMLQLSTSSETEDNIDKIKVFNKRRKQKILEKNINDEVERRVKERQKKEAPQE